MQRPLFYQISLSLEARQSWIPRLCSRWIVSSAVRGNRNWPSRNFCAHFDELSSSSSGIAPWFVEILYWRVGGREAARSEYFRDRLFMTREARSDLCTTALLCPPSSPRKSERRCKGNERNPISDNFAQFQSKSPRTLCHNDDASHAAALTSPFSSADLTAALPSSTLKTGRGIS